jgi:hypothetical protein
LGVRGLNSPWCSACLREARTEQFWRVTLADNPIVLPPAPETEPTIRGFVRETRLSGVTLYELIRVDASEVSQLPIGRGDAIYKFEPRGRATIYFTGPLGEAYVEIGAGDRRIIRPLERVGIEPMEEPWPDRSLRRPPLMPAIGISNSWVRREYESAMEAAIDQVRRLVDAGSPSGMTITMSFSPGLSPIITARSLAAQADQQYDTRPIEKPKPMFPLIGQRRCYFND